MYSKTKILKRQFNGQKHSGNMFLEGVENLGEGFFFIWFSKTCERISLSIKKSVWAIFIYLA